MEAQPAPERPAWQALRRQAGWATLVFGGGTGLLAAGLARGCAWWRLGPTAATASLVLAFFWINLAANHALPAPGRLRSRLGAGNALTLARAGLLCALAGFIAPCAARPLDWIPVILWVVASLLDWADGFWARKTDHVTRLGQKLDLEVDGLGALIAALVSVGGQRLPLWFLGIALLRPLFAAGLFWRQRTGRPAAALSDRPTRRLIAGLQTGFLGGALWPGLSTALLATATWGIAGLLLASFSLDWRQITRGRGARGAPPRFAVRRLSRLCLDWLPVSGRTLAALSVVTMLADRSVPGDGFLRALEIALGLAALLAWIGWGARTAGLWLMAGTGLLSTQVPYVPSMSLALVTGAYVFLSGGGKMSFAPRWDDIWLKQFA